MGNLSSITTQGGTLPDLLDLTYGPYPALDFVLAGPTGSELETWLGTTANSDDFDAVLASTKGAEAWARSGAAVAAIIASSTALAKLVASANAMSFVVRERLAMDAIVGDATAMASVAGSTTAMSAIADSAIALDSASATQTAADVVANSSTAMSEIGANPTAFSTFVSGDAAAKAVAANASVLTTLLTTSSDLADLFSNAAARDVIGGQGPSYDAIKDDDTAIAKYIAASAGLDASAITGMTDLLSTPENIRDVFLSAEAGDRLWRSATASDAFWQAMVATVDAGVNVPYDIDSSGSAVAAGSGALAIYTVAFAGGTRLRHRLDHQVGSDYFEGVPTIDVNVDGVSTIEVYCRAVVEEGSSSYVDGSLRKGASDQTYFDANDNYSAFVKRTMDVSNDSGVLSIGFRSYIRDTISGPAGYCDFGWIRLVA